MTGTESPDERVVRVDARVELLIAADRLIQIGRFVPAFAHELNNCLQAISGLNELASEDSSLSPAVADKLRRIAAQVDRGSGTIRLLLGLARDRSATISRVDLASLVDGVAALRHDALSRLRIEAVIDRKPGIATEVAGSPRELEQMLLALLLNAEDALRDIKRPRRLDITLDADETVVSVAVSDSGDGVSDAVSNRMFDPFVTGLTADDHPGLGLAVARLIAERHGGSLVREQGSRATFVARLPHA